MANEETREVFITRAKVIAAIRRFLDDAGFVEVETPVLQPLYGGALARPFVTHHNALDRDLYLRIATELYLKRLIVGGLERVYEIGKDFRNEGVSFKHNPEFTMLEWYEAYADYDDVARRCEELVAYVARAEAGYEGELDFTAAVAARDAAGAIEPRTGVDILATATLERCGPRCASEGLEVPEDEETWAQLVDHLLSKYVEPSSMQPTFLLDYPVELSPFAKRHRSTTGWSSASRPSRRDGDRQRVHRAQRPRRPARALRGAARAAAAGDEEAQPSTRRSSRRSSTACRRPAGSASASTAS